MIIIRSRKVIVVNSVLFQALAETVGGVEFVALRIDAVTQEKTERNKADANCFLLSQSLVSCWFLNHMRSIMNFL